MHADSQLDIKIFFFNNDYTQPNALSPKCISSDSSPLFFPILEKGKTAETEKKNNPKSGLVNSLMFSRWKEIIEDQNIPRVTFARGNKKVRCIHY